MFGLGKKQNSSPAGTSMDLGMRTMKSDLKSPFEEIHEVLNISETPKKEVLDKKNISLADSVPKNLPVFEDKFQKKTSAIPESSIRGASANFNKSFKKNEFHLNETKKIEKSDYNKPRVTFPSQQPTIKTENVPPFQPAVSQIPDNVRREIQNQYTAPQKQTSKGINKVLLSITAVIFLMTVGSGIYYYFYILNPQNETDITQTIPDVNPSGGVAPDISQPTSSLEENPKEPPVLTNSTLGTVGSDGISATLNTLEIPEPGLFLKLTNQDGQNLSPSEQNGAIGVDLADLDSNLVNSWLYLVKTEQGNTHFTLIYEVSDALYASDTIKGMESALPSKLSGIFGGTSLPVVSGENTLFKDSTTKQGVRYFNFTPGDPTLSIDWTVTEINSIPFLIFANSQSTMASVLGALNQ